MKKFIVGTLSFVLITSIAVLLPNRVSAADLPQWNLTGVYTIDFLCTTGCGGTTYTHTLNITAMDMETGDFSGNGFYNPDPELKWDITGNVDGADMTFHIIYTGGNPGYTVDGSGTITNGNLSGSATSSGQQEFTWQSTSGKADMQPTATINEPDEDGDDISGDLGLGVAYTDDDPEGVQWAVRKGDCENTSNTVAGNVEGYSTAFTWDDSSTGKVFASMIDTSGWELTDYCFVFNPTESSLERDVRLTRSFTLVTEDSDQNDEDDNEDEDINEDEEEQDNNKNKLEIDCDPDADEENLLTKACILYNSGVRGKGILTAPGLQKFFNDNANAFFRAGKKDRD